MRALPADPESVWCRIHARPGSCVSGPAWAPRTGRARFLGLWRLMADIGAAGGPALLSLLAAVLSLASGIAATGLIGIAAAWQLARWIPRFGDRGSGRP